MRKLLKSNFVFVLILCLFISCGEKKGKEQIKIVNVPSYMGLWYGIALSYDSKYYNFIEKGNKEYLWAGPYNFSGNNRFQFGPDILDAKYKYVKHGDIIKFFDDFDRQTPLLMKIKEINDSIMVLHISDGDFDGYVKCVRDSNLVKEIRGEI